MAQAKSSSKLVLFSFLVIALGAIFYFDLTSFLTLEYIQSQRTQLQQFVHSNYYLAVGIYFLVYVLVTGLSLPGAAILTLLGGFLFGLWRGTMIISFASTLGACISFLLSRYLLKDSIQSKAGPWFKKITAGFEKEGASYLFTLRLIPAVPFFLLNAVMGLTNIRLSTYYWMSQIGMLPGTIVYVNAGKELGKIDRLGNLLNPSLIFSFALLALVPFIIKFLVNWSKKRKIYSPYKKPKKMDHNVIVIGAGAAGLVTSYSAAAVQASVLVIDKEKMGGDCLNTGCVPSKALIKVAKLKKQAIDAAKFGLSSENLETDFPKVMKRVQEVIKKIEPHDSVERYEGLGVNCLSGDAKVIDPWTVEIDGKKYTGKNLVVATGAEAFVPPIKGVQDVPYLTTETLWKLKELPNNFLVLGGGPIGCEMAQSFARLGAKVTIVEMAPRLLIREEIEASQLLEESFKEEGIEVLTGYKAENFFGDDGSHTLLCKNSEGQEKLVSFDKVLIALGRRARTKGFGLETLGVEVAPNGTIVHDEFLRSKFPNVFVCGDVAGPYQFTHTAAHQAWYAAVNALFQPLKKFKVDYSVIPWATFTDPEIARVGLNRSDALANGMKEGIDFEVTEYPLDDSDRAIAEGKEKGFIRVLTPVGKDRILGATIVGLNAGELLSNFVIAMKHGLGLNKLLGTIYAYPTLSEAAKMTAGRWKNAHKPKGALRFLEKFHRWRKN